MMKMIKQNKWKLLVSSLVILLPIAAGLILWNRLPERMAMHWDMNGNANGWGSRGFLVFGMPLILLALQWLCVLATSMDPRNQNQTRKVLDLILWIIPLVSLFGCAMIYAIAMGANIGVSAITTAVLGLAFVVIGNLLPKCRPNHTIGIRIKWTLESDANWLATHRIAGKLWTIGGLLFMLCSLLPGTAAQFVLLAAIILMILIPVAYSYAYSRSR